MVTATSPDTEAVTPSDEPVTPVEQEIPGNADAPSADAAAPPEVDQDTIKSWEAEADTLLAAKSKEGTEPTPEAAPKQEQWDYTPIYQQNRQELARKYNERQSAIDKLKDELLDNGIAPQYAERIVKAQKDLLNEHHADALRLGQGHVALAAQDSFERDLLDSIKSEMGKDFDSFSEKMVAVAKAKGNVPYVDILSELASFHRKGYVSEAEAAKRAKAMYIEGRKAREKAGEVAGSDSGNVTNGRSNSRSGPLSQEEAENLSVPELIKRTGYSA